jgi:1,4-alpha-glucan branching enzyme
MHTYELETNEVEFRCPAPIWTPAYLVGDFNRWRGGHTPMRYTDVAWRVRLRLPAGVHAYAFLIGTELVESAAVRVPTERERQQDRRLLWLAGTHTCLRHPWKWN